MVMMTVEGVRSPFLVDTGATRSAMKSSPPSSLSTTTVPVVGLSGTPQNMPLTVPLKVKLGHQVHSHPFLCAPQVPVNLLGRDLLIKLGATILCSSDGLSVTFPDGSVVHCSGSDQLTTKNMLMKANPDVAANIYWTLLDPETPTLHGLLRKFLLWKPFLQTLHPYLPPPDPPHCTLYYDRHDDQAYYDMWQSVDGQPWQIQSGNIFAGPQGCAAEVKLTPDQSVWFRNEDGVPHVSLALTSGHQAKETVKDMLSFLGLTGYSRNFVPDYNGLMAPLRSLVREQGMRNLSARLDWIVDADTNFIFLKQLLSQAVSLATPDYDKPFFLDVAANLSGVSGVLFQKQEGEGRQVLMYSSSSWDSIEKRQHPCAQHVAGVAALIQKTSHIVMGHPLTVRTSHSVVAFVQSALFTMTPMRQRKLSNILTAPNLTFTHDGINMADQFSQGEVHCCEERVRTQGKIRSDLQATPIPGARDFFTDGCCFRHPDKGLQAGFAVVEHMETGWETVKAGQLHTEQSAQLAELVAVIEACKLGEGSIVNIYSDSAYVTSAVHVELKEWDRNGWRTAAGKPIKHENQMKDLAMAIQLPNKIAVVKVKGHSKSTSFEATGNHEADKAAKTVAGDQTSNVMILHQTELITGSYTAKEVIHHQTLATPEEKGYWITKKAKKSNDGVWRGGPNFLPTLPRTLFTAVLGEAHGIGHSGHKQMLINLKDWWHPQMDNMVKQYVAECMQCMHFNPRPAFSPSIGMFNVPTEPGQEIVIDYTDMITPVSGRRYLLVAVDSYTGWVEAVPTRREDAKSVIKFLINHWIPHHGFPRVIRSDNGTHFKNQDLQKVEVSLGLTHHFGAVYHPQSQGKVERMNRTIKNKLAKICAQTKLSWVDALPLAMFSIRHSVNRCTGFTPFELQTGRTMPGPDKPCEVNGSLTPLQTFQQLQTIAGFFSEQVTRRQEGVKPSPLPTAEWVLIRLFKRKWDESRWTGPYRVTARTSHCCQVDGKGKNWYHWSQCAAAAEPHRHLRQVEEDIKEVHSKGAE